MVVQSDVFWKAGLATLIIFFLGIYIGYWLDSGRVEQIRKEYQEMDIRWSDARVQTMYYNVFGNSSNFCEPAIEANLKFADRVYEDGLRIEQYERINKLTPSLITEKTRYVLLKLQFWLNSIELKKNCNADYTNLVYFYSHYNGTMQEEVQGAVLLDLKKDCGKNLMLIPLPIDLDIITIDIIKKQYGIEKTPTILINESIKLEGMQTKNELEKYIKC